MKEGWRQVLIADLCKIKSGKGVPATEILDDYRSGTFPCYGGNGQRGYIGKYSYDGIYPIIGRVGALCGNIHLAEGKFYATEHALVCSIISNTDAKFLCYLFLKMNLRQYAQGAAQPVLSASFISNLTAFLPSVSEQRRIVEILDQEFAKIDSLKSNAEKNLQNAKSLLISTINLLLSPSENWIESSLQQIGSKIGSGATPSGGKKSYGKEGINLIRSLNVYNNEFRYNDLAHINDEQASLLANVEICKGDVLFNITGASVTRCCSVPDDVIPARVNQHVSILRVKPKTILPSLLVYTLISPRHNTALLKLAENGATRQAITKRQLEEWKIQYPADEQEQQVIVSKLDDLNAKCKALQDNYTKTSALCDDLKQALLRKAFNGEL